MGILHFILANLKLVVSEVYVIQCRKAFLRSEYTLSEVKGESRFASHS